MQHNIRRNRKTFEYLNQQLKRINWHIPLTDIFTEFIFENLSVSDSKEVVNYKQRPIRDDIFEIEAVYMEALKFIGLLELVNSEEELRILLARRKQIKYGDELTDFDKLLKAIMTVPNKKEDKK